jgi:hypothetical protein
MSKNTNLQRYECLKTYIQVMEGKKKRKATSQKQFAQNYKYHPALEYVDRRKSS